jgi:hypothetical protein
VRIKSCPVEAGHACQGIGEVSMINEQIFLKKPDYFRKRTPHPEIPIVRKDIYKQGTALIKKKRLRYKEDQRGTRYKSSGILSSTGGIVSIGQDRPLKNTSRRKQRYPEVIR